MAEPANILRVEELACNDAREFLGHLDAAREHWGPGSSMQWIFRGHADSRWKLLPRAWRTDGNVEIYSLMKLCAPVIEQQVKKILNRDLIREADCIVQLQAEINAVMQFCEMADELGIPVPEMNGLESFLHPMTSLKRYGCSDVNFWKEQPFINKAFGLAQHHGIPTRLLDWTRKPLIAAFFAAEDCRRRLESDECSEKPERLAVWAMNTFVTSFHPTLRLMSFPRHQNSFLHAQDAVFVYDTDANLHYLNQGNWPDLLIGVREFKEVPFRDYMVRMLSLPAEKSNELLQLLRRHRISRATLMPTLDNVVHTLRTDWSWTINELQSKNEHMEKLVSIMAKDE